MGQKDTLMRTSSPADVETVRLDGPVTITRERLAAPRQVDAAEAEALFQERVIEVEVGCTSLASDPI